MTPMFDQLEDQLRDAAQAQVARRRSHSYARHDLWRWLAAGARLLPVAAGVAAAAAIVVAALVLLHGSGPGAGSSGPNARPPQPGGQSLPLPGSRQADREVVALNRLLAPAQRTPACQNGVVASGSAASGRPVQLARELAVLRGPRMALGTMSTALAMDGIAAYPSSDWRFALVVAGTSIVIAPVRVIPAAGQPPERCLDAQERALRSGAGSLASDIRAQTLYLGAQEIAYTRRIISQPPYDAVCLIEKAGSATSTDCPGWSARQLRRPTVPTIQIGAPFLGPVFLVVVPDGVASATLTLAPWRGHPATTLHGDVVRNVLAIIAPSWLSDGAPPATIVWRDAAGRTIGHASAGPSIQTIPCARQRLLCLMPESGSAAGASAGDATTAASAGTTTTAVR